jgi:hypothetical protein
MKLLCTLLLGVWMAAAQALELPPQFSDNMVLQRDIKNRIWGKTEVNSKFEVFVEFQSVLNNKPYVEEAHSDRLKTESWEAFLPDIDHRLKSPGVLSIWEGPKRDVKTQRIYFTNVVVGDVWVVALPPGQGSTQSPVGAQSGLRALILPNGEELERPLKAGSVSWAEPRFLQSMDVIAYQFGQGLFSAASKTTPPFGLVVIPAQEFGRWAPVDRLEPALTNLVKATQQQATRTLREQRRINEQYLIELKHQGKVGKVETITRYDAFDVFLRSEKAGGALNFKGVFAPSMKR